MIGGRIGGFSSLFHPGLLLTQRGSSNRSGRGGNHSSRADSDKLEHLLSAANGAPAASLVIAVPAPLQEAALPPLPGSKAPSTAALCSAFI